MNGHTPGPWTVKAHKDGAIAVYATDEKPVFVAPYAAYRPNPESGRDEVMANANLIAAAPELLAALKAMHQGLVDGSIKFTKKRQSDNDPYHPANVLMCAAIAKAQGES